jgi:hypothetical protein
MRGPSVNALVCEASDDDDDAGPTRNFNIVEKCLPATGHAIVVACEAWPVWVMGRPISQ